MVIVERARSGDRAVVERLIADYHKSEGINPHVERISWAVNEALTGQHPSILLVARDRGGAIGVALTTCSPSAELGRILTVNDFYVEPVSRRNGVGRSMVQKLVEEAKAMKIDLISLEVLPANRIAAKFWTSVGFRTEGRTIYSQRLKHDNSE